MTEGKRPGSATAAAIIEIIFASLGSLLYLISFFNSLGAIAIDPSYGILTFLSVLICLVVSVLGFIGGILILTNKKAGIGLSITWSIGGLLLFVFVLIGSILLTTLGGAFSAFIPDEYLSFLGFGVVFLIIIDILFIGLPALLVLCLALSKKSREFFASV